MRLTVNGVEQELASPPLTTLLHVLREELGVTSPKAGCQQGGCGTCTVLVDGEPRRACLTPVAAVEGAEVTTVEGLGDADELSPVQAAFHERYAAQCGFCTAGLRHGRRTALVAGGRRDRREEVIEALAGHVCRCTGYVKIVDAVTAAARGDVVARTSRPTPDRRARTPVTMIPGARHEGRRRPAPALRRRRARHRAHAVRRRRPRARQLWTKALRSPHHAALIRSSTPRRPRRCPACTPS